MINHGNARPFEFLFIHALPGETEKGKGDNHPDTAVQPDEMPCNLPLRPGSAQTEQKEQQGGDQDTEQGLNGKQRVVKQVLEQGQGSEPPGPSVLARMGSGFHRHVNIVKKGVRPSRDSRFKGQGKTEKYATPVCPKN